MGVGVGVGCPSEQESQSGSAFSENGAGRGCLSSGPTWFRPHLCLLGLLPGWRQDMPQGVSQQEVLVSLGISLNLRADGIQWAEGLVRGTRWLHSQVWRPGGMAGRLGTAGLKRFHVTLPAQWSQGCQTFCEGSEFSEGSQSQEV